MNTKSILLTVLAGIVSTSALAMQPDLPPNSALGIADTQEHKGLSSLVKLSLQKTTKELLHNLNGSTLDGKVQALKAVLKKLPEEELKIELINSIINTYIDIKYEAIEKRLHQNKIAFFKDYNKEYIDNLALSYLKSNLIQNRFFWADPCFCFFPDKTIESFYNYENCDVLLAALALDFSKENKVHVERFMTSKTYETLKKNTLYSQPFAELIEHIQTSYSVPGRILKTKKNFDSNIDYLISKYPEVAIPALGTIYAILAASGTYLVGSGIQEFMLHIQH